MRITITNPDSPGRDQVAEVNDLNGARAALLAWQEHTGAVDLTATDADSGERLCRLRFEWLDD